MATSIEELQARIRALQEQLELEYDVFPAVRGNDLSQDELARHYDDKRFNRYEGRSVSSGELGCALSHIGIYKKIVRDDIPHALILEDDAWLNPNLPMILEAISENIEPSERVYHDTDPVLYLQQTANLLAQ